MRNIATVASVRARFVLFVVMCLGSLPLTARAQGNMPQKVLFEQVVELPSKNVNVKIRRVTFPSGFKTPEHTHEGPGPRYVLRGSSKSSKVESRGRTGLEKSSGNQACP